MPIINVKAEPGLIRNETFQEQDHLVIPMVGLVEGVMTSANSSTPSLVLAEEFGKHVESWNGRPVVINHPKGANGDPVSANSPDVLERELIGQLFNAKMTDKKLKFEAWINISDAEGKGEEGEKVIESLKAGELMEISTGLFAEEEKKQGSHFGEHFDSIWRNISPDHLALLPNGIGACSITDGCGAPRANESAFCCTPCSKGEPCEKERGLFHKFLEKLGLKSNRTDSDVRVALQAAIEETNPNTFAFIHAVMEDGDFIYETFDGFFSQSFEIKDDGTIVLGDEPVKVRPETNFVPVTVQKKHPKKEKVVKKNEKIDALISSDNVPFDEDDRNFLDGLGEDKLDQFLPTSENPEEVEKLKVEAAAEAEAKAKAEEEARANAGSGESNDPITAEAYIADAPKEVQDVLNDGMALRTEKRVHLTKGILGNGKNIFSEEDLKAMDIAGLEKLAILAQVDDYTGRGGPRSLPSMNSLVAPSPPKVFEVGKKTEAA